MDATLAPASAGMPSRGALDLAGADGVRLPRNTYAFLLRGRIDTNTASVATVPPLADSDSRTPPDDLHYDDMLGAVDFLKGLPSSEYMDVRAASRAATRGRSDSESDPFARILFDLGRVHVSDNRAVIRGKKSDAVSDAVVHENTDRYLRALGVRTEQAVHRRTTYMMVRSAAVGRGEESGAASQITVEALKKIVYVYRTVNGWLVYGDRLIFSYHLDGRLADIDGRWRNVDYANSRFVPITSDPETALSVVIDGLIERDADPFYERAIQVANVYELREGNTPGAWILIPAALVRLPLDNGSGGSTPTVFPVVL